MIALVCVALASAASHADVLDLPPGTSPVPLVVILHGDRQHAAAAAARWRAAVEHRGWALLALDCPVRLGCKDSFWKWDGDPSWVLDQVAAVAKRRPIDRTRVYLIGWSGGASYIGWRATAWSGHFAAVVLHGGGMPPAATTTCPAGHLPAYFLVGDRNPLHGLAVELRAYLEACHEDVTWDLVRGADHAREEAALTPRKVAEILDWLAARHG